MIEISAQSSTTWSIVMQLAPQIKQKILKDYVMYVKLTL